MTDNITRLESDGTDKPTRLEQDADATRLEGSVSPDRGIGLRPGNRFGDYQIVERLNVLSGEADLYVVKRTDEIRLCMLKLYHYNFRPDLEVMKKIRALPKGGTVEIFQTGTEDDRFYEVQEYMPEGSLADMLKDGALGEAVTTAAFKEISEALGGLHTADILHRDIKPSNILVRSRQPELDLALTDFGFSRETRLSRVRVSKVAGTLPYSAPEARGKGLSKKSDWWSVGMIVIEMLAGQHPFADMETDEQIEGHLFEKPVPIPTEIPARWQMLARGLLTRDTDNRWGYGEVIRWINGERDIPVAFEDQAAIVSHSYKPYILGKESYYEPALLARALSKNWDEARKRIGRLTVLKWVKDHYGNEDMADILQDIAEINDDEDGNIKTMLGLVALDPTLPLLWEGERVTRKWMARHPRLASRILESAVPEFVVTLKGKRWMQYFRERKRKILGQLGHIDQLDQTIVEAMVYAPNRWLKKEGAKRREQLISSIVPEIETYLRETDGGLRPLKDFEAVALIACYPSFMWKADQEQNRQQEEERARKEVRNALMNWAHRSFWSPSDLGDAIDLATPAIRFYPFWGVLGMANVTWSGKKNETGTDGVKRSRTEGGQYTEEKFFYYCGSNSFSPVELGKFGFNQAQLHGHQPEQLQGWTVVENKFAQADISRYAQERVETEERARCAGAVNTLDSFQCQFQTQGPYLVYMPVWTVDYKYKGKAFRAIVRDQDNTVFGSRPLCKRKLTIMLWLIIAIFAACIGVYLWNSYFSGHSAQQAPTARPPSVTLPGASSTTGGESNEKQLASSTQPEIQTPNAQPIAKANPPSINRTPGSTQTASPNPAGSETVSPAEALYKKGLQYYLGEKGVPIQQGDGIELFQQAANQQFPEAEARMAIFSHYGWGGDIDINGSPSTRVERDPQLAENLAKDAINQGLIARAASLGGDSAVTLGDLYLRGIGVKEDDSKAIEQYRNAADQGLPEAQYDLGFCYSQGEGVAQDKAEAAKYYREAADQGLAEAQTALGLCYETGDGVQKDLGKAIRYYKEAANQGEPAAKAVIRLRFSPPQNSGGDNGASTTNPSASPIQPSSDSDNAIGASLGAATSSLPTDPAMFAEDYVNSLGSNDPEIPLVYFGETVAYYDNGNVGTAFLRNDLEHDIKKWSNRRYSIFGEPKILQSSDGYTAEFIMDYTLSNPRVFCLRRNDLKG